MEICNAYSGVEMCKTYSDKAIGINDPKPPQKYKHRIPTGNERYVYHLCKPVEEGWMYTENMIHMFLTPIDFWAREHGLEDACSYNDDEEAMIWLETHGYGEDMECIMSTLEYTSMEQAREDIEASGLFLFDKTFYDYLSSSDTEDSYVSLRDE